MNHLIDSLVTQHTLHPTVVGTLLAFVKTSLVVVTATLMAIGLRHRSAKSRAWVWRIALTALTMLALWQLIPSRLEHMAIEFPVIDYSVNEPVTTPVVTPLVFVPDPWNVKALRLLDRHLPRLWLFGALAMFAWKFLRSLVGLAWLRRHSRSAPDTLANECPAHMRCRLSTRITTPLITGILRPTIWLPEASADWSHVKRHAAFQHELAHHFRRDTLWQWLGTLAACAWWWQPLAWLALRRLKSEAEQAADDWTVTQSITVPDYAEALVNIAHGADNDRMQCVGIAMARTSQIEQRIRALLKPNRWRNKLGFLACTALALLAISLTSIVLVSCKKQPPRYVSLAKLVAGGRMVSNTAGAPSYIDYLQDFYGTIIETLESAAMHRQALERVRVLNPEIKECDVDIKVTQNKGSAIFNVAATGTDPKFTRIFLDALLDEFRAFRDQIREQQRNKALTALAEDVVKRETRLKEKGEKLALFKKNNNMVVLTNGQNTDAEFLKQLTLEKNRLMLQLTDLDLGLKDVDAILQQRERTVSSPLSLATGLYGERPGFTQAERDYLSTKSSLVALKAQLDNLRKNFRADHPLAAELKEKIDASAAVLDAYAEQIHEQYRAQKAALERQITVLDQKIQEFNAKASEGGIQLVEYERLQKDYDESEKAFKEMLDLVHKSQVNEDGSSDYITIMQRAEAAVEVVPKGWF